MPGNAKEKRSRERKSIAEKGKASKRRGYALRCLALQRTAKEKLRGEMNSEGKA